MDSYSDNFMITFRYSRGFNLFNCIVYYSVLAKKEIQITMKYKLKKNTSMKIKTILYLLFIVSFISCKNETRLEQKLKEISNIQFEAIQSDSIYNESYEIWYTQKVDNNDENSPRFKQRVVINHVGFDKPTVVILEGYNIVRTGAGELSKLLNANQISIEHRFFDDSKPDSIPWEYLTIKQAADDQHQIIESLKKIYTGKWISTGISKGGQTTMYHKRFYPDDVDASVVYVAPLNLSREDKRITRHLETVGTKECRDKIRNFQINLFEKKDKILPLLEEYARKKQYTFDIIGIDRVYDLNVLEYSFAFWQWSGHCSTIPDDDASLDQIFYHWQTTAPFSFFYDQDLSNGTVFMYQALTEIGFYDYNIEPFRKYLKDTVDITFDFRLPANIDVSYNISVMEDINWWLHENGNNMLYIYGEYDPWGATAVEPSERTNSIKMVNPHGNHATRIKSFPVDMRKKIYATLENWLDLEIEQKP